MNKDNTEAWVQDLVEWIRQHKGEDAAKDFQIYWNADERELVFEGLVEMFVYEKTVLPPELQKHVMAFAEQFDARSKGRTHFAKDLHELYDK